MPRTLALIVLVGILFILGCSLNTNQTPTALFGKGNQPNLVPTPPVLALTGPAQAAQKKPNCGCLTEIINFQPSDSVAANAPNGAENTTTTVSFELKYSDIPPGYALDLGIVSASAPGFQWLSGDGSIDGSQYFCGPNAHCYFQPSSSSGLNSTTFTITFGPTPASYDLEARVYVLNSTYFDIYQEGGQLFADHGFLVTVPAPISAVTSTAGLNIPGLGFTIPYTTLAGSIVPLLGVISGYWFKTRKRRLLTNYLSRIDVTYKQFSTDEAACLAKLEELKTQVTESLRKGKIDDGHFQLLNEKIQDYIHDLSR